MQEIIENSGSFAGPVTGCSKLGIDNTSGSIFIKSSTGKWTVFSQSLTSTLSQGLTATATVPMGTTGKIVLQGTGDKALTLSPPDTGISLDDTFNGSYMDDQGIGIWDFLGAGIDLFTDGVDIYNGDNDVYITSKDLIFSGPGPVKISAPTLKNAVDDTAAAAAGVALWQVYRTGNALKIRIV